LSANAASKIQLIPTVIDRDSFWIPSLIR
jgi:hypothetical protein